MSRKEKFGSSSASRHHDRTAEPSGIETNSDEGPLPPRRRKYPSSAQKATKWYYNLIVFLFLFLVIGLFWYGKKFSE